jgi:hypothetical protein
MSLPNLNEPVLSQSNDLIRTPNSTFVPFSAFKVDGIGQGSVDDIKYRPNASFHAIQDIALSTEGCKITYTKALKPLERNLKFVEIIRLIQDTRMGQRDRALGQEFYIYPGIESFATTVDSQQVHIVLRNIRPLQKYQNYKAAQLSVEAFLQLIEHRCPSARKKIQGRRHEIMTLAGLENMLSDISWWDHLRTTSKWVFNSIIFLILLSIPTSIWGPSELKDPLQQFYQQQWNEFTQQIELQRQKLSTTPGMNFQFQITVNQTISQREQNSFEKYIQKRVKKQLINHPFVIKLLIPQEVKNSDKVDRSDAEKNHMEKSPSKTQWMITLKNYRGSVQDLIQSLQGNLDQDWRIDPKNTLITIETNLKRSSLKLDMPSTPQNPSTANP